MTCFLTKPTKNDDCFVYLSKFYIKFINSTSHSLNRCKRLSLRDNHKNLSQRLLLKWLLFKTPTFLTRQINMQKQSKTNFLHVGKITNYQLVNFEQNFLLLCQGLLVVGNLLKIFQWSLSHELWCLHKAHGLQKILQ